MACAFGVVSEASDLDPYLLAGSGITVPDQGFHLKAQSDRILYFFKVINPFFMFRLLLDKNFTLLVLKEIKLFICNSMKKI
jgi:hypothetical protein